MKADHKGNCFNCGLADLEPATVELAGTVRDKDFSVSMRGLKCPNCGFQTIEGEDMPEYGRLLADKYRAAHGLLTSDEIRERRLERNLSQQAFADFLKRSPASVKRWEWGKIQDHDNDRHIREMTDPVPATTVQCVGVSSGGGTLPNFEFGSTITIGGGTEDVLVHKGYSRTYGECIICNGGSLQWQTSVSKFEEFEMRNSTSSTTPAVKRYANA